MRTTLDIDEDILGVTKQLAQQRNQSAGKVLSDLARQGLQVKSRAKMRNGVRLIEPLSGAAPATLALVNRLRDEE